MIPNFTSLTRPSRKHPPTGRTAISEPTPLGRNELVAQHGISELDGEAC